MVMESQAAIRLRRLRFFQEDDALPRSSLSEDGKYRLYGFTMYRTDYSQGSDELWAKLLADVRSACERTMSYYGLLRDPKKRDEDVALLTSLFTIDARSDKDLLDGCSVEQLRDIYNDCVGGIPLNPTRDSRAFFYVDAEAFQSLSQQVPYIKMGDPDYEPERHRVAEDNWRLPLGQDHWGWFRLEVDDALTAWDDLDGLFFDEMAPRMLRNPECLMLFKQYYKKIPNTNNLEI